MVRQYDHLVGQVAQGCLKVRQADSVEERRALVQRQAPVLVHLPGFKEYVRFLGSQTDVGGTVRRHACDRDVLTVQTGEDQFDFQVSLVKDVPDTQIVDSHILPQDLDGLAMDAAIHQLEADHGAQIAQAAIFAGVFAGDVFIAVINRLLTGGQGEKRRQPGRNGGGGGSARRGRDGRVGWGSGGGRGHGHRGQGGRGLRRRGCDTGSRQLGGQRGWPTLQRLLAASQAESNQNKHKEGSNNLPGAFIHAILPFRSR